MPPYSHPVVSIREVNPGLPPVLRDINLNDAVAEGEEIEPQHLRDAKATVVALRGLKGLNLPGYAELTDEVVESAESRAQVLGIIHAQSKFVPATLTETLLQIRQGLDALNVKVDGIDVSVKQSRAESANAVIKLRNRFVTPRVLSALQKSVPGSGIQLAQDLAPDPASRVMFNAWANGHPEIAHAALGAVPIPFNPTITNYDHLDCLKLVYFYNENMGIAVGDGIADRRNAISDWLNGV